MSKRILEHYNVFNDITDLGMRERIQFMWSFYQVEDMPLEGVHHLGIDYAYSLEMKVCIYFISPISRLRKLIELI